MSPAAPAEEWRQFRGPAGLGIAQSTDIPAEFGAEHNVIWKTLLPQGASSPVLTEDRIFVTAYEDEKLFTFCLERETGKILWRREAPRPRQEEFNQTHGPASPSPVTDGENVYVFFGDFGLLSYGGDGQERWRLPLGPFYNHNGHGSSPILVDGMLVLICDQDSDSFLLAVNQGDGSVRWKTERPEVTRGYATPGVYRPKDGPAQLIIPGAYQVSSYALETGEKLWWVSGLAWQLKCVPIIDGDTIYVNAWESGGDPGQQRETPTWEEALAERDADGDKRISRQEADARMTQGTFWKDTDLNDDGFFDQRDWDFYRARSSPTNNLIAIRPAGRRGDVTDSAVLWRFNKALPNTSSPLLYDGVIYLVKDGGIATTVDAATGEAIKQERLRHAMDKYWASPVAADGKVFMVSEACSVTVLQAGGEWEVLAVNELEDHCFATPAIADARIYLRTTTALYCFGKRPQAGASARLR